MKDRVPSVRTATLGDLLTKAIEAVGLSQSEAARKLGCSPSGLSRLLRGVRGVDAFDVAALLGLCEVPSHERDTALRLMSNLSTTSWLQEHGEYLPAELRVLDLCDKTAEAIWSYQTTTVPRLLRTESYLREVLRAARLLSEAEIEQRVALNATRQAVLDRKETCTFRFYLDEHVINRGGLDQETASDQLHHLLRIGVRPNIDIRIVPESAGPTCATHSFELFKFPRQRPTVYLEHLTSTTFLEHKATITTYRRALTQLHETALNTIDTRDWLLDRATPVIAGHGATRSSTRDHLLRRTP